MSLEEELNSIFKQLSDTVIDTGDLETDNTLCSEIACAMEHVSSALSWLEWKDEEDGNINRL